MELRQLTGMMYVVGLEDKERGKMTYVVSG